MSSCTVGKKGPTPSRFGKGGASHVSLSPQHHLLFYSLVLPSLSLMPSASPSGNSTLSQRRRRFWRALLSLEPPVWCPQFSFPLVCPTVGKRGKEEDSRGSQRLEGRDHFCIRFLTSKTRSCFPAESKEMHTEHSSSLGESTVSFCSGKTTFLSLWMGPCLPLVK